MDEMEHIEHDLTPWVCVVDDDDAVRLSVRMLVEGAGHKVRACNSGSQLLSDPAFLVNCGCLILDVRMPGPSGLAVQKYLIEQQSDIPIIFISGHGDVPMVARTMRLGAMDFLQKPFDEQDLLDRVQQALTQFAERQRSRSQEESIRERLLQLTPREVDVMAGMLEGRLNKVIAADLGISIKTVEQHRARIMDKMRVESLAELVRQVVSAGIDIQQYRQKLRRNVRLVCD